MRREAGSLRHPIFSWNISCLAVIMGETGDSGHGLGLCAMAKHRGLLRFCERLLGNLGEGSQNRDQG